MGSESSKHRARELVVADPTTTERISSSSLLGASFGEKSALQTGTMEGDFSKHDTASETPHTYPTPIAPNASLGLKERVIMDDEGIVMSDNVGINLTEEETTIYPKSACVPDNPHAAQPFADFTTAIPAILELNKGPTSKSNTQSHDPDYTPVFNRLINANIAEHTRTLSPNPRVQHLPSSDEGAVIPQHGPFLPSMEQIQSTFTRSSELQTNIANTTAYRANLPLHIERKTAPSPRTVMNTTTHPTVQPFSTEDNDSPIISHTHPRFSNTASNSRGHQVSLLTHTAFSADEICLPMDKQIVESERSLSHHAKFIEQMTWHAQHTPSSLAAEAVVVSNQSPAVEKLNRVCSPPNTRAFRRPEDSNGLGAPLSVYNHRVSPGNTSQQLAVVPKLAEAVRNGTRITGMGTLAPGSQSEYDIANAGAGYSREILSARRISTRACSISGDEEDDDLDIDAIEKLTIDSRKKFRKLRIKFDDKMRQSDEWYRREQKSEEQIKRLAQENDQLLDLLLDVNDSAQIPTDKRFDLTEGPSLLAVPPLVSDEDLAKAAELDTAAGQAIYKEIRAMMEEKEAAAAAAMIGPRPPKALSALMSTIPHLSSSNPLVPPELIESLQPPEGHTLPLTYLTPDQIDDYLFDIDASLGTASIPPVAPPTILPGEGDRDLALRNPNSVYNWLRKNEPKVFLQDNEGSEKSLGKPGALRGAGKRASIPAPSKPDALEFVEEDGIGYDGSIAGPTNKGKRKRDGDDGGTYHPKAGKLDDTGAKVRVKRAYNRKKKPEDGETPAKPDKPEKKKGGRKPKEKVASPAPGAHPFGPM